jgi:hypothetical protein
MQQLDLLIQEIESIDDYLGPTFRYRSCCSPYFSLKLLNFERLAEMSKRAGSRPMQALKFPHMRTIKGL